MLVHFSHSQQTVDSSYLSILQKLNKSTNPWGCCVWVFLGGSSRCNTAKWEFLGFTGFSYLNYIKRLGDFPVPKHQ